MMQALTKVSLTCESCGREITGNAEPTAYYNMKRHREACMRPRDARPRQKPKGRPGGKAWRRGLKGDTRYKQPILHHALPRIIEEASR